MLRIDDATTGERKEDASTIGDALPSNTDVSNHAPKDGFLRRKLMQNVMKLLFNNGSGEGKTGKKEKARGTKE